MKELFGFVTYLPARGQLRKGEREKKKKKNQQIIRFESRENYF